MHMNKWVQNLKHMTSTVAPTFIDQDDMTLRLIDLEEIRADDDPVGKLMFSMVLYLRRDPVSANFYLEVPEEYGGGNLTLSAIALRQMVPGLGLKPDTHTGNLVAQRMTCLFRAMRPDRHEIPVLHSAALMSKSHRDRLDFTADDIAGPLSRDLFVGAPAFGMPDLSSIRENVWF